MIPMTQITTIPIAPTPTGPMLALEGSTALITVTHTTAMTSSPSSAAPMKIAKSAGVPRSLIRSTSRDSTLFGLPSETNRPSATTLRGDEKSASGPDLPDE
jgi:hypothetical protein